MEGTNCRNFQALLNFLTLYTVLCVKILTMKYFFVLAFSLTFTHFNFAQNYVGKQKHIDRILENVKNFSSYVVAADYDKIADSYTADGKLFPNNKEIIEGTQSIRNYWVLPEGVRIAYHKITPIEIKIKGKEAYDYGYYEGTTKRAGGEEVSWRGKYVIIWKRVNKDWKIYLDIWNRIQD